MDETQIRKYTEEIKDTIISSHQSNQETMTRLVYTLQGELNTLTKVVGNVEVQTTKTNGRVTLLEKIVWTGGGVFFVFSLLEANKIFSLFQ